MGKPMVPVYASSGFGILYWVEVESSASTNQPSELEPGP